MVACGQAPQQPAPAPPPRAVDTTTLAAERLVDAVLDECHAPLRAAMARVAATVRLPDGTDVQVFAELPDKLRVQSEKGRYLLRGNDVFGLDEGARDVPSPAALQVRRLRTLLDAAAFGPLHRATACRRLGPSSFELTGADGATTVLALRPGTLLPQSFGSGDGAVVVLDYLRTQTTWIARELELAGLGRCRVQFDSGRIDWAADFFAPPGTAAPAAATGNRPRLAGPGATGEPQSPTPVVVETAALQWAIVRDAADWAARVAAYRPLHAELTRQDQAIAGFPVFWQEDGVAWLAAPFRQRPEGAPFRRPRDWQLRDVPAGRWLVVYPEGGDFADKRAAGERLLQEALRARRLTGKGPITAQPFFHLEEGEPPADRLAAPKVRMAVRID